MRRIESPARADWRQQLTNLDLIYHSGIIEPLEPGADLSWHEASHWRLSAAEVDLIEDATLELHRLCLSAVDHVFRQEPGLCTSLFGLPDWFAAYAAKSWLRGDPTLMGRMDLAFDDATGAVKMLEYNAETPTMAIETAVAQWQWLEQLHPHADQFNSLHEKLIARFAELKPLLNNQPIHFATMKESPEEWAHITYFRDLAQQAGIRTYSIDMHDVGWDGTVFRDLANDRIRFLHKLYPWEWARTDPFGPHLANDTCGVLEPPWKALLSDKAILALLWRLYPGHPNLLKTVMGQVAPMGDWVCKPCLGRAGGNVSLLKDGRLVEQTDGPYGQDGGRWVCQARATLPKKDGWSAVIGSWIVGDQPAGIIFRESRQAIVQETSRVVPHLFESE